MYKVLLPELGEGIDKAVVACWHYREGEPIRSEDDIVELVTDKASFNVPSEKAGVLAKILVHEGEQVKIGEALAIIE